MVRNLSSLHPFGRLPLVALVAAAAALLPAAVARADAPVPSGPPDGARVERGAPLALHARGLVGETGLWLLVSASEAPVDECGRLDGSVARAPGRPTAASPALYAFDLPRRLELGTWWWQIVREDPAGGCEAAPPRRLVVIAPKEAPPARPLPLSKERIPRSIGRTIGGGFEIAVGGRPARVTRARLIRLARNAGVRWGLRPGAVVGGRPTPHDGRTTVGFARRGLVSNRVLGLTLVLRSRWVRGGRVVRTVITERDVFLRPDVPWQAGPAYPQPWQYDLQTVLLHELGHFAGNRGHVRVGCRDTPMVVALAPGEWWRSTKDFHYRACDGAKARAAVATALGAPAPLPAPHAMKLDHVVVDRYLPAR